MISIRCSMLACLMISTVAACGDDGATTGGGGSGGEEEGGAPEGGAGDGGTAEGGAGGGAPGWEPTAEQVEYCETRSAAICASNAECLPASFATLWGDEATCAAGLVDFCLVLFLPGSEVDASDPEGCAAEIEALDCIEHVGIQSGQRDPVEVLPSCGIAPGTLQDGDECVAPTQCASLFCERAPTDGCGTCAPAPIEGDACVEGLCEVGLVCAGNTCTTPGAEGDTCSASQPCGVGTYCNAGTCVPQIEDGDACDGAATSIPQCRPERFCNISGNTCELIGTVESGATCGLLPSGALGGCGHDEVCEIMNPTSYSGTCVPTLDIGESCSGSYFGFVCGFGAACVAGKCTELTDAENFDPTCTAD